MKKIIELLSEPHNIVNFGLPVYLIVFERILKGFSNVDTSTFIPSALAASGLSLICSTVKPKELVYEKLDPSFQALFSKNAYEEIKRNNPKALPPDKSDIRLINFSYISIFVLMLIWFWVCSMTAKNEFNSQNPNYNFGFVLGLISYFSGLILSIIKDLNNE